MGPISWNIFLTVFFLLKSSFWFYNSCILIFDIGLAEFFYILNVMIICHFINKSRLVLAIFIKIVVEFRVREIWFFNNFWYISTINFIYELWGLDYSPIAGVTKAVILNLDLQVGTEEINRAISSSYKHWKVFVSNL